MSVLSLSLHQLAAIAAKVTTVIGSAVHGTVTSDLLKRVVPEGIPFLEEIAEKLFPAVVPELKIAAAAITTFDPDRTRWLQEMTNTYLKLSPPIDVDGEYGPDTVAAVKKLQIQLVKDLGIPLVTDGFLGKLTMSVFQLALAKVL